MVGIVQSYIQSCSRKLEFLQLVVLIKDTVTVIIRIFVILHPILIVIFISVEDTIAIVIFILVSYAITIVIVIFHVEETIVIIIIIIGISDTVPIGVGISPPCGDQGAGDQEQTEQEDQGLHPVFWESLPM